MVEREKLIEFDRKNMLVWSKNGKPQRKIYLNEEQGRPITNLWDDIPPVQSQSVERVGYATQKPEALLERIIKASSNEGDLVLDCFAGSGTTAAVAEKLGRRWIACDLGRFAIHTTRKRLLQIPGVRPFVGQNLGKYERQLWQTGQFARAGPETPEQAAQRQRAYVAFILKLYGANGPRLRAYLESVAIDLGPYERARFDDLVYRRREFTEQWAHEAQSLLDRIRQGEPKLGAVTGAEALRERNPYG